MQCSTGSVQLSGLIDHRSAYGRCCSLRQSYRTYAACRRVIFAKAARPWSVNELWRLKLWTSFFHQMLSLEILHERIYRFGGEFSKYPSRL